MPSASLILEGANTGQVTLTVSDDAGGTTFVLPSVDGTNGQVLNTDGNGFLNWTTLISGNSANVGTQGYQGYQGYQVAQGSQGVQGRQGSQGSAGAQGVQGALGTGTQGAQGVQGAAGTGSQGAQGVQGAAGVGSQGAQGVQGAAGTGSQGAQGVQGATGAGAQGVQGSTGPQGPIGSGGGLSVIPVSANSGSTITANGVNFVNSASIIVSVQSGIDGNANVILTTTNAAVGTQGVQGAAGSQGAQGATGAQGVQGATGAQGDAGAQGVQGAAGAQGDAGAQGVQGSTGAGTQGAQGAQGVQGESGAGVSGGTTNNVAKYTSATTVGNSLIFDTNTSIGIGTSTPTATLDVAGNGKFVVVDSTRVNPRVISTADASSITPNVAVGDQYNITALAQALTINAPVGVPVDGNKLTIRLLDNGTTRALTWNATYTVIGTTLPTSTTASKISYIGCIYNSTDSRWDVIAATTQV